MPNLNELEQEVNNLKTTSSPFAYFEAYDHLIEVLQNSTNGDKSKLQAILKTFRNRLLDIDLLHFEDIRENAKALHEALAALSVGQIIQKINERNQALRDLKTRLQHEINKGNAQANVLQRIKNAVEQGTVVIDEINNLVTQLNGSNNGLKDDLEALLKHVGNISNAFMPDENNA